MTVIRRFFADPAVRLSVSVVLLLRVITLLVAAWGSAVLPSEIDWSTQPIEYTLSETITSQGVLRSFVEPWFRWDTGWYVFIAHEGYAHPESIIFPPLYPALIRLSAPVVGGDYVISALVISTLSMFTAFVLLYKIAAVDFGDAVAAQTLILISAYPVAFYLVAGYTESLFLALTLGAWWMVTKKQYWIAGILAFFAALTRSQGWTLVFPFAYMVYVAPHGGKLITAARCWIAHPLQALRPLPAVIGGGIGTTAYVLSMRLAGLGNVEEKYSSAHWRTALVPPWDELIRSIQALFTPSSEFYRSNLTNIAAFMFVALMVILMARRMKPQYTLYATVTLLFILLRSYSDIVLHGMLRYALEIFPAFIMLAIVFTLKHPVVRGLRLAILGVGMSANIFFLLRFVWWGWVA